MKILPIFFMTLLCATPAYSQQVQSELKASELNESAIQKLQQKDLDGAELDLLKSMVYANEHPQLRKNLSIVFYEKGIQYLKEGRDLWSAMHFLKKALDVDPESKIFLRGYAAVLFAMAEERAEAGRIQDALHYYERAANTDPKNISAWLRAADYAWKFQKVALANMFYERAKLIDATHPSIEALGSKINQLTRETDFSTIETEHFIISIDDSTVRRLGKHHVMRSLEKIYREVQYKLPLNPPVKFTVVFYSIEHFKSQWDLPNHVTGIFDGKIRLPLTSSTRALDDMDAIIKHELTHALIHWMNPQTFPKWLTEGIAQWVEGKELNEDHIALLTEYEMWMPVPSVRGLEAHIQQNNRWAYVKALSLVDFMVHEFGIEAIIRGMESWDLRRGFENEFKNTFRLSQDEVENRWEYRLMSREGR